jgi:hypothetical protein
VSKSEVPECYLLVATSAIHGRIDFHSDDWKASTAAVIAASQLRDAQEVMLLLKPGDWVRTDCGLWRLTERASAGSRVSFELTEDEAPASMDVR